MSCSYDVIGWTTIRQYSIRDDIHVYCKSVWKYVRMQ